MKKSLLVAITAVFMIVGNLNAQDQIVNILKGTKNDINLLGKEYLRPYGEMLGVNLNSGWYNSAKVHKIGGFDITITGTYTTAPSSKQSFVIPQLESLTPLNGATTAPTMAGDGKVAFGINEDPTNQQIELEGAELDYFITPMIQGSVGLPFHTEIMGRFMPRVEFGDYGKAYMWGLGLKHSLKDYIPFVKRVPFLQLSVLGAYTQFESKLGVNGEAGTGNLEADAAAYTGRLLLGANLPVVAFYTGVGYGNTQSNFDLVGDFSIANGEIQDNNPLSLDYSTGNFDFNVGMRIRLAIFSIHADYSVGDYSVISGGVGINFR